MMRPSQPIAITATHRTFQSIRSIGYVGTSLLAIIGAWEILDRSLKVPPYLLPSPLSIWHTGLSEAPFFLHHAKTTFTEAFCGWLLASLFGLLAASIFVLCRPIELAALPLVVAAQAVPIVAVAPLLILWLGDGLMSKVVMAATICTAPIILNSVRGMYAVSSDHLAIMKVYGANRWQVYMRLRLPTSVPYMLSGLKIAASLAMIGAIVAEYAGANRGLGYLIMQSTYRLDTARLFVGILFTAFGGWLLFGLAASLERLFLQRYTSHR